MSHAVAASAGSVACPIAPPGEDESLIEARTVGGENHPMVVLSMADGITLAETENHAILLSTGVMVAAKDLTAGQTLVRHDGSPNEIAEISRLPADGYAYNVLTDAGLVHQGHMVVANDLIVGDLMWQNTLSTDLNAIIVRQ